MAFAYCTSLQSFSFGKNVKKFDGTTFLGCSSLKEFTVDENNQYLKSVEGVVYSKDGKRLIKSPIALYSTSYVVPDGVEVIENYAFQKCKNIVKFILPESLTTIKNSAFSGCVMRTINIPNSVNSIDMFAFQECENLESMILPYSIKKIPSSIASWCSELSYLYLPYGVKTIDSYAFASCKKLSTISSMIKDISSVEFSNNYEGKVTAFENIPEDCLWIVPEGSTEDYKSQPWWVSTWRIIDSNPIKGDVNKDLKVDISDIVAIINYIAGTSTFSEKEADVNEDGKVDISDIVAVINIIAGN